MKTLHSIVLVALAGCAHVVNATEPLLVGCYSSAGSMEKKATIEFNSRGECRKTCVERAGTNNNGDGYAVMAMTKGDICYCGNLLPHESLKVDAGKCKMPCPGFGTELCGSRLGEYFSVYTTGLEENPDTDEAPSSSATSASKTSTSKDSSTTGSATATNEAGQALNATVAPEKKSVNKAEVAAGAVVGVLAIIALGVGVFIFLRKRRRQEVEDQYRRSAAVRGFVQKPALDNRLDPVMVQRRDSVGSIADNQDYSRKILRVTNPDG